MMYEQKRQERRAPPGGAPTEWGGGDHQKLTSLPLSFFNGWQTHKYTQGTTN